MAEADAEFIPCPPNHLMARAKEGYEIQRRQAVAAIIEKWLTKRKVLDFNPTGLRNLTMADVADDLTKALIKNKQIFFCLTADPEAPLLAAQKVQVRNKKDLLKTVVALQAREDLTAARLQTPTPEEEDVTNRALLNLYSLNQRAINDPSRYCAFNGEVELSDGTVLMPFPEPAGETTRSKPSGSSKDAFGDRLPV